MGYFIFGFIFLLIGLLCAYSLVKHKNLSSFYICICFTILFIIWGLAMIILGLGFKDEKFLSATLILGIGLLCISVVIFNISNFFTCKKVILGQYTGYNRYSSTHGITLYSPIFDYEIDGIKYHTQCFYGIKYNQLQATYEIGNTYEIFINEKNPNLIIVERKIKFNNLFLLMFGIFLTFIGVNMFII